MRVRGVRSDHRHRGLQTSSWRRLSPCKNRTAIAWLFASVAIANAEPRGAINPTTPDPPARRSPPAVGAAQLAPAWNLDGLYVWLGPTGAASRVEADWDSTIGADLAVIRVRERAPLAAIGGSLGASRWTERGGGRIWLDAIAGTRIAGRMVGISAGPILELSDLQHPRVGASAGLWAFVGITPFVRFGSVQELGTFGEIGIHLALPVYRR